MVQDKSIDKDPHFLYGSENNEVANESEIKIKSKGGVSNHNILKIHQFNENSEVIDA